MWVGVTERSIFRPRPGLMVKRALVGKDSFSLSRVPHRSLIYDHLHSLLYVKNSNIVRICNLVIGIEAKEQLAFRHQNRSYLCFELSSDFVSVAYRIGHILKKRNFNLRTSVGKYPYNSYFQLYRVMMFSIFFNRRIALSTNQ